MQALPHNGATLMKARWPATGCSVDAAALEQYEALKQLVRGVRNARLEYGLEQARKVNTHVLVSVASKGGGKLVQGEETLKPCSWREGLHCTARV